MNNNQTKTMEELKDSRIMFEKPMPRFGYMIVLTVVLLMIGIVIWSIYTPKVYMIKAAGTVTSENSNYIMPPYTGEIVENYMQEGMFVEKGDVLFTVKSTDYDIQQEQLEENKITYEEKISQYERLVKSIKDDTNYFDASNPDDSLYHSTYEVYKAQVAQSEFDASTYKSYGYSDEQIEEQIEINQNKISEIYFSTIQSAENAIAESELQIASIDAQLSAITSGQNAFATTATASGTLHLLGDYKEGMVVQTAAAVATITPENSNTLIESYVTTADMARMHIGDSVQMEVSGLTQTVYGTISGEVVHIDSNVTSIEAAEEGTTNVFKIKIKPDYTYLISKSGEKINVSNGMSVESRIEYDKVTYFNYVIEKLGFMVR